MPHIRSPGPSARFGGPGHSAQVYKQLAAQVAQNLCFCKQLAARVAQHRFLYQKLAAVVPQNVSPPPHPCPELTDKVPATPRKAGFHVTLGPAAHGAHCFPCWVGLVPVSKWTNFVLIFTCVREGSWDPCALQVAQNHSFYKQLAARVAHYLCFYQQLAARFVRNRVFYNDLAPCVG